MKKITEYIFVAVAFCFCLASCIALEDDLIPSSGRSNTVEVMASVADFSKLNVGTKAIADDEKKVTEITMIIFDANGNIVGNKVNLTGANSVFMIETQSNNEVDPYAKPYIINGTEKIEIENSQEALANCTIYMVANCWSALENEEIKTVADLNAVKMPVTGIEIPETGFPMIGSMVGIDLSRNRAKDANSVADIPMDKLYAKVNVRFQINADQVIETPKFTLKSWTVSNVPAAVALGVPAGETVNAQGTVLPTTEESRTIQGRMTISHSESTTNPDFFQFTFYMPEHKVTPNKAVTYPTNLPPTEKQRYKPLRCEDPKKPTYVTVTGAYTDHHGQVKDVTYSLYLGQDNYDNFDVLRNQELNNFITIKGLTNSKGAVDWVPDGEEDNISVDHRVDVTNKFFSVAMEREALLDSHFEVRPMDVFVSNGGKVVVTVNSDDNDATDDWLRIEKSTESDEHIAGVGVRKYFTTDLVTSTLASIGRSVTINSGDDSRIWLYFDENRNVYDKTLNNGEDPMYRDISLTVGYYKDANANIQTVDPDTTQTFNFRQMNLWRVRGTTNYYDIEYHEEYLYNYVSDDNYQKYKDGMAWGLDGVIFSDTYEAFAYKSEYEGDNRFIKWITELIADVVDNKIDNKPFYDFYVNESEAGKGGTARPYKGKDFSNEIMEKIIFETKDNSEFLSNGQLNTIVKSAVEYCYHKNKRDSNGNIITANYDESETIIGYNTNQVNWFLPSIDQIEEIVVGGYSDFEVFQNKFYWASQPSYIPVSYTARETFLFFPITVTGQLFFDDEERARATKVNMVNGLPQYVTSGTSNPEELWNLSQTPIGKTPTGNNFQYDSGNFIRAKENRIRCVRDSGPVSSLSTTN